MTKYSTEEKVEAVLAYLEGKESYKTIAEERKMSMAPLKRWVLRYREHGVEGLVSSMRPPRDIIRLPITLSLSGKGNLKQVE